MKRRWTPEELDEQWTLLPAEVDLVANKTGPTPLGFSVTLKAFQLEGRLLDLQTIPSLPVAHVARQVWVPGDLFLKYDWGGRAARCHPAQIREFAGFRESTDADATAMADWLRRTLAPEDHRIERWRTAVLDRYRELRIEPPSPLRMERMIRSGLHTFERALFADTLRRLPAATRRAFDNLVHGEDARAYRVASRWARSSEERSAVARLR